MTHRFTDRDEAGRDLGADVLARLDAYRSADAPTHGGRVLSYVYDSGLAELDALAGAAAARVQAVNALDPTTFPSVALLQADVLRFAREVLGGGPDTAGAVTSGGTESILLAVLAARERWRERHPGSSATPRVVAPSTAHAAFHKAAHYLGLDVVTVPVDPGTGTLPAERLVARLDDATALVVVSAPAYPHGVVDPVGAVATAAAERGIPCHVDACVGGFVLPWWPGAGAWDLSVPGVTSISADLHKFGYAPKGASVLLFADPALDRARYYALTGWPGYPVVNPTALGSRSAMSLAAAWAVLTRLGPQGYADLTARVVQVTTAVRGVVDGIVGLRVLGDPVGPLLAAAADTEVTEADRVDPHAWAAAVARRGFVLQGQPGMTQTDGSRIPRSTHLTITPVTSGVLEELGAALVAGAEEVRGRAGAGLPAQEVAAPPDPALLARTAWESGELDLASVLGLIEALPRERSAALLVDFLAEFGEGPTQA
ncbi:pyridoxal-dependent decarboxylase [Serinicoccus sp. CUA-874]|uniref:pyridoxal phosphate-dependent decarboxylase family protein n=1 Tax=Serinicoccus sp. CUA-874 TaxID=1517939 RepID=UPI00095D93EC|nr:aminotransferase class V-fold PLP-dependent enzyme [Serinicoccus sp. CUA-874]OLT17329.1 pyridoxal-dependent decarboxylase [Serinicoccus sp. CUA-874]